jgi:hypothetical protein
MLPREYVGDVNVVRAAHSDRYLFAHIGDKRIAKLAENYKNSRPAATTMGFGSDVFAPIKVARRSKDKRERVVKADR